MIKTVKQACRFNPVIREYRMSEAIENLASLISDEGDGREFFARNYVTEGMDQLFRMGLLRLAGKSDQSVFELSQAMGGGKTHMMVALGLLAKHPQLRGEVLDADLTARLDFGSARVAAFNGRHKPENYIWGEIATQLGAAEAIKPHWVNGPKSVDQATWKKVIGDAPTLILLDELPPYLQDAATVQIGSGTLATQVVYSLSTLMTAALELPNCVVVIANLSGSYEKATKELSQAISDLEQETHRQSRTITPVQLAGNEIYEILKKRLIEELPDERTISEIAEEYAAAVKHAQDRGDIIATSIEQIAEQVRETYPFHPAFKHLVALFKENEGFRQTRGLMQFTARLLKSIEDRETDDVFLIGTQHLNLNDSQVRDEITNVAPKLGNAVTHDIADRGRAIAEEIDDNLSSDAARQVMTLLLTSSLSRSGGRIGLSEGELIEFLAAPQRKPDEFQQALQLLTESAWYLHREDGRYFVKETENLARQIEREAKSIAQPKIESAFIKRLAGILAPKHKIAYQDVQVLPKFEDLHLGGQRTLIVIKPDGKVPPSQLQDFFAHQQEKNNFLVLSGQDSQFTDAVESRLRELYAIEQIQAHLKPGDTLYEEARERRELKENEFASALASGYNCLYVPMRSVHNVDELTKVTISPGLMIGNGDQTAEIQIETLLAAAQANFKLVSELTARNAVEYIKQAEEYLWPVGDGRRARWADVTRKALCSPVWPWMPGARGIDDLKQEALKQGEWRDTNDGYVEHGPFPKDKATATITEVQRDEKSGDLTLSLMPVHAGNSPIIYWSPSEDVSNKNPQVLDLNNFSTAEATLYFLVRDSTGEHESAPVKRWTADIKIRHQVEGAGGKRTVTLAATPRAEIFYTLNGANPKDGTRYEGPFEVGAAEYLLLAYARKGAAEAKRDFTIPKSGDIVVRIDEAKPARLQGDRISLGATNKVFEVINRFRDDAATVFHDVRIEIGEAGSLAMLRFSSHPVNAATIENIVNAVRGALGEDDAPVAIEIRDGGDFSAGIGLIDFATLAGYSLRPGDVTQQE